MRAKILTLALALAAATPAFAKTARAPAEPEHTGPIPYSDLAAVDAKMNAPMGKKHHVTHKKAAASASASASTTASGTESAPAK